MNRRVEQQSCIRLFSHKRVHVILISFDAFAHGFPLTVSYLYHFEVQFQMHAFCVLLSSLFYCSLQLASQMLNQLPLCNHYSPNIYLFFYFSLLAAKYRPFGVYKDSRSILVIHNLAHQVRAYQFAICIVYIQSDSAVHSRPYIFSFWQGVEPASTYPDLGLPPEWYGALEWVFPEWARRHALDKGEAVNFLKGAVVTADRIVTVSKVILHITVLCK